MKLLAWLKSLVTRRDGAAEPSTPWKPSGVNGDIDIVLSEITPDGLDAGFGDATDYDVRSLGGPIDPTGTSPQPIAGQRRR